ncbi:flagellar hook-length control protein FliK [Alphaproteobacteria bacterium]|nr:flagellar hook-length control protein FliK [Alphaproteobacteria bacterium]
MSKIVPKTLHTPEAQSPSPSPVNLKKTADDLLFAALFNGANTGEKGEDLALDNEGLAGYPLNHSENQENSESSPHESALIAAATLPVSKAFGAKSSNWLTGDAGDTKSFGQDEPLIEAENADALADLSLATLPSPHGPANLILGSADRSATVKLTPALMAFEDGDPLNLPNLKMPKKDGLLDRGQMPGAQNPAVGKAEVDHTEKKFMPTRFIGPLPAQVSDYGSVTSLANNRALSAANLKEYNSETDAKVFDFAKQINSNKDKNLTTVRNLRQAMLPDSSSTLSEKALVGRASGYNGHDILQPTKAVSAVLESASGFASQSQSGAHTGGHSGGQSNGQAGSAATSGLMQNLNMLQTLDMARSNWNEMLVQRVQKGLAGGRDQLDFQLNPRKLGKMRISLVLQNDRTNIKVQTETSAAAMLLSESEGRLAQMLEASGLRLGNFNSGLSQGFDGKGSDGHGDQKSLVHAGNGKTDDDGNSSAETITEQSENLINIQA